MTYGLVVTYTCEPWTMSVWDINNFLVSKRHFKEDIWTNSV